MISDSWQYNDIGIWKTIPISLVTNYSISVIFWNQYSLKSAHSRLVDLASFPCHDKLFVTCGMHGTASTKKLGMRLVGCVFQYIPQRFTKK